MLGLLHLEIYCVSHRMDFRFMLSGLAILQNMLLKVMKRTAIILFSNARRGVGVDYRVCESVVVSCGGE